jgi:subfamily B ATP-binding cassette protein MsbA
MAVYKPTEPRRRRKTASLWHFKRILQYVWPQKRYLVPLALAVIGMAITYSVSIGSILPTLAVIMYDEGIHGWVDQRIVQSRLDATVRPYSARQDNPVEGIPEKTALVTDLRAHSPLVEAGVHRGDFILGVDGVRGPMVEVCAALAAAPDHATVELLVHNPSTGEKSVTANVGERGALLSAARSAVGLLPGGLRPEERLRTLMFVLGVLFVVLLAGNVSMVAARYLTNLVCARAVMDLRREMYAHVLKLPMSRFARNPADLMSRFVQDMQDVFRGLLNFFDKVVAAPLKALGVTCVALWLQPRVTIVVLFAAPVVVLIVRAFGKKIRRANRRLLAGYGRMLSVLESTLYGMRVVKGYTRENYERKRLLRVDRVMLNQQLRLGLIESLSTPVIEFLGFFAAVPLILWFAQKVVHQQLGVPEFLTMIFCFGAIFDPIRQMSKVYPKVQRAASAGERLFEVIDSPSEYRRDATARVLAPIRESVEFRNVSFTYPEASRPALRNINLKVRKGETVAIVGANGSGKTTLVSLILRFFEPEEGQVLIDGVDIADVKLRSLRRQISLITQETVIFPDTVANNIRYGRPGATMDEVISASKRAFADEFIRQLPEAYETMVGEHGATLSGGQRQRIAIARAILRDAPLLVFDEATGQIDPESELKIHQALGAFLEGRTAFFIAHHYSTISEADRIVVMDDGQIVAVGTHARLLESSTLYQRLYETQFRDAG